MNIPAPFTEKQHDYLLWCLSSWFNVAEGGKRGGKNVLQTMAFCMCLDEHPNRIHLVAGVSGATAGLNILDCDGYGLYNYFEGRWRKGKFENRECVYIQSLAGEKIVLISGGGKIGDEKLIKGNTYGMAYVTEANECAQPFLQEVFDRTLSSKDRKIFHDLNPKNEGHWYYSEILKHHTIEQLANPKYGYNYGHFTIADNMSISDEELRQVLSTYDKNSIWYQRDILGKRKQSEGLVYQQFANNKWDYLIKPDRETLKNAMFVSIGIDFGGNRSLTTFVATAIHANFQQVTAIADYHIAAQKGEIDADRLCREFIGFVQRLRAVYPWLHIKYCWADNEAQYLINSLRKATRGLGFTVEDCKKKKIMNRIIAANTLLNTKRMFIASDCRLIQAGLENAVWDDKKNDVRLDNFSTDIDILDAFEYSWEPFIDRLCPDMKEKGQ